MSHKCEKCTHYSHCQDGQAMVCNGDDFDMSHCFEEELVKCEDSCVEYRIVNSERIENKFCPECGYKIQKL